MHKKYCAVDWGIDVVYNTKYEETNFLLKNLLLSNKTLREKWYTYGWKLKQKQVSRRLPSMKQKCIKFT